MTSQSGTASAGRLPNIFDDEREYNFLHNSDDESFHGQRQRLPNIFDSKREYKSLYDAGDEID